MPTPVGHTLAGLAIWAVSEKPKPPLKDLLTARCLGWAALCVTASNIPDADFITITRAGLEFSGQRHHGITHSIGFAVGLGVMVWVWGKIRKSEFAARAAALTTVCYSAHIFLDLFNVDTYPVNGIGLPALWPLTDRYFIFPIFPGASRVDILSFHNVVAVGLEVLLYSSVFLAALMRGRSRGNSARTAKPRLSP
ncbi:hypothetical protein MNBD_NITROSPINAE04-1319 [hydrothermal vent metagenome]|uniref:Membrane-bound metal-dependent hydrolase YdjM, induced during SOS response n=1 Tax=hydrothermal vent metagenome TaxID=652676 RepID=A0A3B1B9R8_9ZZZZ